MRAVRIPMYADACVVEVGNDAASLQLEVGGSVKAVPVDFFGDWTATGLFSEEQKRRGVEMNPLASMLAGDALLSGEYVAGTMLIVGDADANGDFTDVPRAAVAMLTSEEIGGPRAATERRSVSDSGRVRGVSTVVRRLVPDRVSHRRRAPQTPTSSER